MNPIAGRCLIQASYGNGVAVIDERGSDMTCNVGGIERPIRIGAGVLAIMAGLFAGFSGAMSGIVLAVGVILLLTGGVGYCPLFALLGVSTCTPVSSSKK